MSELKQNTATNIHELFELTTMFATTYTVITAYNIRAKNRNFSVQVRFRSIQVLEVWYLGLQNVSAPDWFPLYPGSIKTSATVLT
jgi:hypothetical protein